MTKLESFIEDLPKSEKVYLKDTLREYPALYEVLKSLCYNVHECAYDKALRNYAYWRDGIQFVGCGIKTLDAALSDDDRKLE